MRAEYPSELIRSGQRGKYAGDSTPMKTLTIKALWDEEAQVWVATSDDVPGLVTEAETAEALEAKLKVLIPELLIENGVISEQQHLRIPFHLLAYGKHVVQVADAERAQFSSRSRFLQGFLVKCIAPHVVAAEEMQ